MRNYKIGDRLRCIDVDELDVDNPQITLGDIYEVVGFDQDDDPLIRCDDGNVRFYATCRFNRLGPIEVGDTVYLEDYGDNPFTVRWFDPVDNMYFVTNDELLKWHWRGAETLFFKPKPSEITVKLHRSGGEFKVGKDQQLLENFCLQFDLWGHEVLMTKTEVKELANALNQIVGEGQ